MDCTELLHRPPWRQTGAPFRLPNWRHVNPPECIPPIFINTETRSSIWNFFLTHSDIPKCSCLNEWKKQNATAATVGSKANLLVRTKHWSKTFICFNKPILTATLWSRCSLSPHFTGDELASPPGLVRKGQSRYVHLGSRALVPQLFNHLTVHGRLSPLGRAGHPTLPAWPQAETATPSVTSPVWFQKHPPDSCTRGGFLICKLFCLDLPTPRPSKNWHKEWQPHRPYSPQHSGH